MPKRRPPRSHSSVCRGRVHDGAQRARESKAAAAAVRHLTEGVSPGMRGDCGQSQLQRRTSTGEISWISEIVI